jgi:hypothetical protein
MTEKEWFESSDPEEMLVGLKDFQPSDRKLRLFMCACCRRIWNLFKDDRCREAVEVAERYADGLASEGERQEADEEAANAAEEAEEKENLALEGSGNAASLALSTNEGESITWEAKTVAEWTVYALTGNKPLDDPKREAKRLAIFEEEVRSQCVLLRDIFGNPFRPVTIHRSLRIPTVVKVVQQIYEQRALERLPKVADALEKAGCDNPEILNHCRMPGPHVKGCWLVDAVLGKE